MNTKILSNNSIAAAILAFAILISATILATSVRAASIFDIEFPIAALGNCADKSACKAYCNESTNESACQAFASKYNLGDSAKPVQNAADDKFKVIETDGGPGNCAAGSDNPRQACESYCDQSANMRECVAYAKKHNLMPAQELAEAEKVIKALDSGVKLPAACTDGRSCKATCDNPKDVATARSCFEFAEQAGLLPPEVDREKAEKMFKAMEDGRAPFKSPKEFEQCENPPSDEIFEKCVNFALETGMLPPNEAEMIRKTGGKGPGGCRGKAQCETYCENNQEACFQFAEENGLISEAERTQMKEGSDQFRKALDQAPPEVAVCLKDAVGAEVFDQIQAGTKPPSRELGEKMKNCFETVFKNLPPGGEYGPRPDEGKESGIPPEVKACLENKLGADGFEKMQRGSGDPSESGYREVIENCFRETFGNQKGPDDQRDIGPNQGFPPGGVQGEAPREDGFKPDMRSRGDYDRTRLEMMERERSQIEGGIRDGAYDEEYRRQYEERYRNMQGEGGYPMPAPVPGGGSGEMYSRPPEGGAYPMPPEGSFVPPPAGDSSRQFEGTVNPPSTITVPPPTDATLPPREPAPTPIETAPTSEIQSLLPSRPDSLLANVLSAIWRLFNSEPARR